MQFFEYPYVIITILAIGFIIMGIIGLYFTIKSVRTATGTVEKSFCGLGRIENDFEKASNARTMRCIVYISISLDSMKRLYSESKATRIYEQIKKALLRHFGFDAGGEISLYGNNGFVAITRMNADETVTCIEKCFNDVNEILISNSALNIVHVNFGYYCTNSTEVTFKTAISRAKQAYSMAEAEETLYCEWQNSSGKEFERKIKMENNIQSEIENNRFFLEYQPIIDARTGKIMGAEVLSRLNSSTDGIVSPNTFLSAVKNVGLNEKFDRYIFEKNCKWISNNKEQRSKYVYTINFSRSTLCDEGFADNIIEIVEKYGCSYNSIAIEILEDKDLTDAEKDTLTSNLIKLKEKGVMILLDDFGKGYTNFTDLAQFDISIVKIDKSITQNATNNTGFLILKNIIQTAHDLGFKTLCEGIETEEHKNTVTDAGCDLLQGYYFYRSMSVTKLEELFDKQ